ncbi:MAG: tRNA (cytidine(34)-2'-O)-methyltransferase [Gallicola sp.]|nr:tRNA (cytidine(34)-2'-O)-methyltransferase [Gallicola sp.]
MMHIVLLEPEMPSNTGNIGRTCLLTNTRLHLIRPFKFQLNDKTLKRAGLDYWKDIDLKIHDSYKDFLLEEQPEKIYYATTKTENYYHEKEYQDGVYILFGKESKGIPEDILKANQETCIKIPMILDLKRSLNLANSVNIVLFEALRQNGFKDLG